MTRITVRFLWIPCGWRKTWEMIGCTALRHGREGSRNAFTAGGGRHLGATPEAWENPGNRSRTGTCPRRRPPVPVRPGNWTTWQVEAGQGPSVSYMEGPLLFPHRSAAAGQRPAARPWCAQRVDHLCTKGLRLCVRGKMRGIASLGRSGETGLYLPILAPHPVNCVSLKRSASVTEKGNNKAKHLP